jgi:hypothetical protein
MKKLLLILFLFLSLNVTGQTLLKDKKQELRVERVIQNSENTYKVYFHATYLVVGNKSLMMLFLEELLNVINTQQSLKTYVGNTPVKYEAFEDEVEISARNSKFRLSKKQIVKLKKKLI